MRLFLIRHGETVDNVANLYAGTRDSALTTHGVLQARRLAEHLAQRLPATSVHYFSSDLQRAVRTAEAIRAAACGKDGAVVVQQLVELREKDFGTGEGERFGTGKDKPHEGAESAESMKARVDTFLDKHLLPVLSPRSEDAVVIVAHGILLSILFKRLCEHLSSGAFTVAPEVQRASNPYPAGGVPVLPSWSNTGYLEAVVTSSAPAAWSSIKLHVAQVNCVDHLKGLRKTRGGIGSARFDEKQKTMDSFFAPSKKRKLADAVAE